MIYVIENEIGEELKVEADDLDEAYRIMEHEANLAWQNVHDQIDTFDKIVTKGFLVSLAIVVISAVIGIGMAWLLRQ